MVQVLELFLFSWSGFDWNEDSEIYIFQSIISAMVCLLLCSSCQVICYLNYYLSFITWLTFATIVKSDEYQSFLLWGEGVREGWKPHYTGVENFWHADQKIGSVLVNVNDG